MIVELFAALVVIALLAGFAIIGMGNNLVRLQQAIAESWSDVDVELKRRHDLVPNLVEVVKGAAAHERGVFETVAQQRAQASVATDGARIAAENELAGGMARLLAVAEAYPQLRANASFLALQKQLSETEDRIQAARRFYNANVRDYNNAVETFPSSMIAQRRGLTRHEFLQLDDPRERAVPEAKL